MKKFLFLAFVSTAMLLTSSCSKDVDLTGTTWNYNETTTETYEGISMTNTVNADMEFTSETAGSMAVVDSVTFMTFMGQSSEVENTNYPFTYTFDGESAGTLTATITDEDGETETSAVNFTYDAEAETITVVDEDVTMVFHKK